jgi:hypothetical protein
MKFFWTVPFINPNTWDRLSQRILAQFVRPSSNSITITLKRLVALLEEDETDEYGILQPSQAAFRTAMGFVVEVYDVKADAYFLRANEIGLSVNLASECSPEQCAENFRQCYGVASLEVGSVREIGLNVEQDKVNHANIMGLPYKKDDLAQAERLAGLLAKKSQIVWKPKS